MEMHLFSPFLSWLPGSWWLVLLFYNLLLPFLFVCLLPGWFLRANARGRWNEQLLQRFGWISQELHQWCKEKQPVWIHAVSVGESHLALRLLENWLEQEKQSCFVVTTTTATARALLEETIAKKFRFAQNQIQVVWTPFDFLPCAWLAVLRLCPQKLVLTEGEWWPNWIAVMRWKKVPVCLFNVRMSPRSAKRMRKFRFLVGPLFQQIQWIGIQFEEQRDHFRALGVKPECLQWTGSVKYDLQNYPAPNADLLQLFQQFVQRLPGKQDCPIIMGISTFAGEELLLARVSQKLMEAGVEHRLVLVPRHAERGEEIRTQLEQQGWQVLQRSKLKPERHSANSVNSSKKTLLLVDSTGELKTWLHLARVAVIGKSWFAEERGGQNPVEPLQAGAGVICGPHMGNFRYSMVDFLEAEGVFQVQESDLKHREQSLFALLQECCVHPEKVEASVQRGRACLERHKGATARTATALLACK